jgi:hypothetical protein
MLELLLSNLGFACHCVTRLSRIDVGTVVVKSWICVSLCNYVKQN